MLIINWLSYEVKIVLHNDEIVVVQCLTGYSNSDVERYDGN